MATRKLRESTWVQDMAKSRQAFLDKHPALNERFYVLEVTPPSDDDYGGYVEGQSIRVSDYYDTKAEAEEWIEGFDPAKGNHFSIQQEFLREYTERRWTTY